MILKNLAKKILSHRLTLSTLAWIGSIYLRLLARTMTLQHIGSEGPEALLREGKPFMVCFWHGRLMMLPFSWVWPTPLHVLISQHRDGRLIAKTVEFLGIKTFAGSSSKNGAQALKNILKHLQQGHNVGITPDGPRGPARQVKDGLVKAAIIAKVPIFPLAFASSRSKVLGTWDSFIMAKPFGRGAVVWGEPFYPPKTLDETTVHQAKVTLTRRLDDACDVADAAVGMVPPRN